MFSPDHIHDDDLDSYVMHRLFPIDKRRIEEHLLLCGECQQRLAAIELLIEALRAGRDRRKN